MKRQKPDKVSQPKTRKTPKKSKQPINNDNHLTEAVKEVESIIAGEGLFFAKYITAHVKEVLEEYRCKSPLFDIAKDLGHQLDFSNFETSFIAQILRRVTPLSGVIFSLKTYMAALDSICLESMTLLPEKIKLLTTKEKQHAKIALHYCEEPVDLFIRFEKENILNSDNMLDNNNHLLVALFNDRYTHYLESYKINQSRLVSLYKITLGDVLVCAIITPRTALEYDLTPKQSHTIKPPRVMYDLCRDTMIELKKEQQKNLKLETELKKKVEINTALTEQNKLLNQYTKKISDERKKEKK